MNIDSCSTVKSFEEFRRSFFQTPEGWPEILVNSSGIPHARIVSVNSDTNTAVYELMEDRLKNYPSELVLKQALTFMSPHFNGKDIKEYTSNMKELLQRAYEQGAADEAARHKS